MYGDVSLRPRFALVFANHYVIYVISKKKKSRIHYSYLYLRFQPRQPRRYDAHFFRVIPRSRLSLFIHLRWMDESSKAHTRGKRFTPVNKKKKKIWRKERKILGSRLWTRLCVEKNMENERYGWKLSGGRGRTTRSTRENRRIDRWPLKGSSRIREEIVETLLRSCVSPYDSWKQETASGEELQRPCRKRSRLTSYSPAGRAISSIDPFRGEETCAYTTPTPASPALNVALTVSPPPPSSSSGHPSLAMASKHGRETYSSRRRLQLSIQTYSSLHQFPPSFAEERKDWRRATSPFPLEFSFEYSRMNFLRKVYICNRVHRISYYIWLLFMKTGRTVFFHQW